MLLGVDPTERVADLPMVDSRLGDGMQATCSASAGLSLRAFVCGARLRALRRPLARGAQTRPKNQHEVDIVPCQTRILLLNMECLIRILRDASEHSDQPCVQFLGWLLAHSRWECHMTQSSEGHAYLVWVIKQ